MEKIDISKIRGQWQTNGEFRQGVFHPELVSGGDDTIESIRMVAEKVNEIIDNLQEVTK